MTQDFHRGCWLIEKPEAAMKAIIRNLESSIWRDSMKKSGMLSLMDVQAHDGGIVRRILKLSITARQLWHTRW